MSKNDFEIKDDLELAKLIKRSRLLHQQVVLFLPSDLDQSLFFVAYKNNN
ncbi:hypothetical protein [Cytobacillus purgationiresistens]|uniref:Uncharacterized protein n=1 Tax=Cytobacillus purgationiresistens TaxID=863449 RepID=A0ABU0AD42_9BACI|nr:hypothetical protein [Cytobacillus purgationiresistens]MDQ0269174.1 hypothetical protein [Cytobacillus purgationiresistens]